MSSYVMSEISRSRVARIDIHSSQTKDGISAPNGRPSIIKRNSWTNLANKARRFSLRRKRNHYLSSSSRDSVPVEPRASTLSHEKGLEDYTTWCNHYLVRGLHREITMDLRTAIGDGTTLINLVECLTKKNVPGVNRQPMTWSEKLNNIQCCFHFLNANGISTTSICPEDIIEGNLKSILRLFYSLEQQFEISHPMEAKTALSRSPVNGRISSGYHSEDDANINGRTTPTIEALPGLLAGSDTESDNDSVHPQNEMVLSTIAKSSHYNKVETSLDNIGYMPSHPSRQTRTSGIFDDESDKETLFNNERRSISTSNIKLHNNSTIFRPSKDQILARDNYGLELDPTSDDNISLSSTCTPVLPNLSSASSFEDLPLDFSSDASGLRPPDSFTTSSKLSQDSFSEGHHNSIQRQIDVLHSMQQRLLTLVHNDSRLDKGRKGKQTALSLKTKEKKCNKKRRKDIKSLNGRFSHIESNVVTLARNIDHLRSEIHAQREVIQKLQDMRTDMNEIKNSFYLSNFRHENHFHSQAYNKRVRSLNKLKRFFGEEPPIVAIILHRMGYERFIPHFKAQEIGILELPYMTEQRLHNMGIPLGPRLRILEEIQRLR